MRCKACDTIIHDENMRRDEEGEFIDLCPTCLPISNAVVGGWYHDKPDYAHGDITEAVLGYVNKGYGPDV